MSKYYKAEMDKLLRVSARVVPVFFILFPFLPAVKTGRGLFVLSPDDTKDFAASLNSLLRK